jgi:hypothetical protein
MRLESPSKVREIHPLRLSFHSSHPITLHYDLHRISRNDVLDVIPENVSCWVNTACNARMSATFTPTTNYVWHG